jgi:hypothetical protein
VIVAAEVTQQTTDHHQLLPMLNQVEANLGRKPQAASADAGYFSEANLADARVAGVDLCVASGRDKHEEAVATASGPPPEGATASDPSALPASVAERGRISAMRW